MTEQDWLYSGSGVTVCLGGGRQKSLVGPWSPRGVAIPSPLPGAAFPGAASTAEGAFPTPARFVCTLNSFEHRHQKWMPLGQQYAQVHTVDSPQYSLAGPAVSQQGPQQETHQEAVPRGKFANFLQALLS